MLFNNSNNIAGSSLKVSNPIFRMLVICLLGIMAFASAMVWRWSFLMNREYVDLPMARADYLVPGGK
ncbi:MAG: hypothetical protein R3B41_03425 [Candidatus Doudnabacteria bacterium]